MTHLELRIAVAEAMGYVRTIKKYDWMGEQGEVEQWTLWGPHGEVLSSSIPDYPNDLNAMHKVEQTLKPCRVLVSGLYPKESEEWERYFHCLMRVCEKQNHPVINATATQRCEAYLRIKNLWKEPT